MCILSRRQKGYAVHEVVSENMSVVRIKKVAENSTDQVLKIGLMHLIASEDAKAGVAFDIKYHLACLISAETSTHSSVNQFSQTESILMIVLLSDMEIVEILEQELNDSEAKILNMIEINIAYIGAYIINLLEENGVKNVRSDYKKHLTDLIRENIPNFLHFSWSNDRTKPVQVLSLRTKEKVISKAVTSSTLVEKDSVTIIMKTAQIVRKDILEHKNAWQFTGSFSNCQPPSLAYILCKHISQVTPKIDSEKRESMSDKTTSLLAQHMFQAFKTDRQVSYKPKNENTNFVVTKATP